MRILIAGCGDVGSALALRLLERHEVWGLRRNVSRLPAGVRGIQADLTAPGEIELPELDALAFCAAAKQSSEDAYRAVYVEGLHGILQRLEPQKHRLKRILFTSSTSVYGQDDGGWVDEHSPTVPRSFSGQVMLEAERLLADYGVSACSLRFGGIYGPGRDRLLDAARRGEPSAAQQGIYGNRIHRDDCAGMLAHLLEQEEVAPCYLCCDNEPAPMAEVIHFLRAQMQEVGISPLTGTGDANWPQRGGNKRCCNRRIRETGYPFQYPDYRAGYSALIQAWNPEKPSATT